MPRKTARKESRAAATAAALAVLAPTTCQVCVVGGGAAGLMAALAAAQAGAQVVVLERALEPGRTILATGNGRCNLSNEYLYQALNSAAPAARRYRHAGFARAVMGAEPQRQVAQRFAALGLETSSEEGRVYPLSRVATSVRATLVAGVSRLGVTLCSAREVVGLVRTAEGGYRLRYRELGNNSGEHELACRAVVLASGGALTGGRETESSGTSLQHDLTALGIGLVAPSPILCPLACAGVPHALDGRRVRCTATLSRGAQVLAQETGEVLLRKYGLSGVVIFDLSRVALAGDCITLNLLPHYRAEELAARLVELRRAGLSLLDAASGMLDPAIAHVLVDAAQRAQSDAWEAFAQLAQAWSFEVTGTADEAHAQVTRGGIEVSQLDEESLSLSRVGLAGLYACGEAVDVDGPCGGYNLGWAWCSGELAGRSAAGFALGR